MIHFDFTKTGAAGHRSGLTRVSRRLRAELGAPAAEIAWPTWDRRAQAGDWFFTAELFSEEERPGFGAFVDARPCRLAAIYYDSIPLKHPHITWPQSVARHPSYLKLLARFDHVWAVSHASREELLGIWRWQGIEHTPPVDVLALGADFDGTSRRTEGAPTRPPPVLLCLGIVEPRKNQAFLLDVCTDLWRGGLEFELHIVGRVNPLFGRPVVERLRRLRREFRGLHFHEAAPDETVRLLYARARASVFPTIAEGCGLPLLESLWLGVPCVCSDLPVLRENADGGGCAPVATNDRGRWAEALREILTNDALHARLAREAQTRPLPTWREAARAVERGLK